MENITQSQHAPNFWAIIPAGGVGSRLWPLSRAASPKFLLDLTDSGKTLLQNTWDRLVTIAGTERTIVVTGKSHLAKVGEQLPALQPENVIGEPSPCDSSAAIGLAAAIIELRDPDAIVGSFAADHVVTDTAAFERAVKTAIEAAQTGNIITIGITPTHPSTGFGYIKITDDAGDSAQPVEMFVEKPDENTAAQYFNEGVWLWNGGMFIAKASVLLDQMALAEPELVANLRELAQHYGAETWNSVLAKLWNNLPKIAIDYTVAEPAAADGKMQCVPASFGWDDIGDFASIAGLLSDGSNGPVILGDNAQVIAENTSGIIVPGKRVIATYGLENIVIVDTPDALLVTTCEHAQKVKNIVAKAGELGLDIT